MKLEFVLAFAEKTVWNRISGSKILYSIDDVEKFKLSIHLS